MITKYGGVKGIAIVCFCYQVGHCSFIPTTHLYLTSRQVTCLRMESFGTSNDQVHEMWECDLSDQADAWPLYPSMNVYQIGPSWKQYDSCSVGSLYNAQLLAHLSNTQVVPVQLKTNHHYEGALISP